jgi:hypothetical protein
MFSPGFKEFQGNPLQNHSVFIFDLKQLALGRRQKGVRWDNVLYFDISQVFIYASV